MRLSWAIAGGLLAGIGIAWWLSRESPEDVERKQQRARQAGAANARDARPSLYRWRDASGVLQVTQRPPSGKDAGRRYQRIDVQPRAGIEVDGRRE